VKNELEGASNILITRHQKISPMGISYSLRDRKAEAIAFNLAA